MGDATMLSDEETRQALRSAIEAAAAEKVLMAGVSRDSVVGDAGVGRVMRRSWATMLCW